MASFSTQFHADVSELATAVETWMTSYSIWAVAVRSRPFRAASIGVGDVRKAVGDPEVACLAFTEEAPVLEALTQGTFLDRNPSTLLLDVGRMTERGLAESWLCTTDATPVWKTLNRDLKRGTMCGATAVNEQTGATSYLRAHRYTTGALVLFDAGIRMLPIGGTAVLRFSSNRSDKGG